MMCIASAATSSGPTTRPIGSDVAQLLAPRLQLIAEERRRQRRVDEAGGDQVDADGCDLEREAGRESRERGGRRGDESDAHARPAASGAAHEQERTTRANLGGGVAGDAGHQQGVLPERAAGLVEVHLGQGRVVGAARRRQYVVDGALEVREERLQGRRVVRVEGGGAERSELGCRLLQPLGIAAGQDHVGALGPCAPCRLQADAGATADQDDGLAGQLRVAHRLSSRQLRQVTAGAGAISARSAFSASM